MTMSNTAHVFEQPGYMFTGIAGAAGNKHKLVTTTADGLVAAAAVAGVVGLQRDEVPVGTAAQVVVTGIMPVIAKSAITVGQAVTIDTANAGCVKAAGASDPKVGVALTTKEGTAEGYVSILLQL